MTAKIDSIELGQIARALQQWLDSQDIDPDKAESAICIALASMLASNADTWEELMLRMADTQYELHVMAVGGFIHLARLKKNKKKKATP